MWPIGPLMHEHRLIERMLAVIRRDLARVEAGGPVDHDLVAQATEFFRSYADRCHHGKEEDILFRELAKLDLAPELKAIMAELVEDHRQGRQRVGAVVQANQRLAAGDGQAQAALLEGLGWLCDFYPRHIAKEDKHFFFPCMELFSDAAKQAMLAEFYAFDQRLVHEIYRQRVETLEGRPGS